MSKIKHSKSLFLAIATSGLLAACNSGTSSPSQAAASISYATFNNSAQQPGDDSGITGVRGVAGSNNVYITGDFAVNNYSHGSLYVGPISGGGTYYNYDFPNSIAGTTVSANNVYSADNYISNNIELVGTYDIGGESALGYIYRGPIENNYTTTTGNEMYWQTLNAQTLDPTAKNTYPHSVMGNLVVGNYDNLITSGNAFIYNINNTSPHQWKQLVLPGTPRTTTLYGVWYNGGTSYTLVGGLSDEAINVPESQLQLSKAFIIDYDSVTESTSNFATFTYQNQPSVVTHFEGITTDGGSGYNLSAMWLSQSGALGAAFANITRNADNSFALPTWINVEYPNAKMTTGDTVYQNYVLGVYSLANESGVNSFVATIPKSWY